MIDSRLDGWKSWTVGLLVALLMSPILAGPAELERAAVTEGLQAWLEGTHDLEGRFEQTLVSGALGSGLAETGRIYLWRPGKMRWEYLEPERKVALIDGDSTWLYLEEDSQLWEGRLEEGALLTALLTGTEPVADLFDRSLQATPEHGGEGAYRLRLVPLGDVDEFRQVVLTLRAPGFAIEVAEVLDSAGNQMRYRFDELRRNAGLSESWFHFEPPAGTEVLRP